jgi:hypothetical protein
VLLTSFDTIRSAFPVGLCSAGTNVDPLGAEIPAHVEVLAVVFIVLGETIEVFFGARVGNLRFDT